MYAKYNDYVYTEIKQLEEQRVSCPADQQNKLSAAINLLVASKLIRIKKIVEYNTYLINPKEYIN